jgi:hypothetical protein
LIKLYLSVVLIYTPLYFYVFCCLHYFRKRFSYVREVFPQMYPLSYLNMDRIFQPEIVAILMILKKV